MVFKLMFEFVAAIVRVCTLGLCQNWHMFPVSLKVSWFCGHIKCLFQPVDGQHWMLSDVLLPVPSVPPELGDPYYATFQNFACSSCDNSCGTWLQRRKDHNLGFLLAVFRLVFSQPFQQLTSTHQFEHTHALRGPASFDLDLFPLLGSAEYAVWIEGLALSRTWSFCSLHSYFISLWSSCKWLQSFKIAHEPFVALPMEAMGFIKFIQNQVTSVLHWVTWPRRLS